MTMANFFSTRRVRSAISAASTSTACSLVATSSSPIASLSALSNVWLP